MVISSAKAGVAACSELIRHTVSNAQASSIRGMWWWDAFCEYECQSASTFDFRGSLTSGYRVKVCFAPACVLLAISAAPDESWAKQACLLGPPELAAVKSALDMLEQVKHRGRNIEASFKGLNCLWGAARDGKSSECLLDRRRAWAFLFGNSFI